MWLLPLRLNGCMADDNTQRGGVCTLQRRLCKPWWVGGFMSAGNFVKAGLGDGRKNRVCVSLSCLHLAGNELLRPKGYLGTRMASF